MAKRKGKVEMMEETLDGEIEAMVVEQSEKIHTEHKEETIAAKVEVEENILSAADAHETLESKKPRSFKLQFVGREYVEERFPKQLEFADRLAQEWITEGDFNFIEVTNPRAKEAIVLGLQNIRAAEKVVEKKVEETYSEYSEKLAPYAKLASERIEKILSQVRR